MSTLIVENGDGIEGADAYVPVDYMVTYAAQYGLPWSPTSVEAGDAAIRRATTWLDARYRKYYSGERVYGREQGLEWPRRDAYDADGNLIPIDVVPIEVQRSTCEAASRELTTPGTLAPTVTPGRVIKSAAVSGAVSVTYSDDTTVQGQLPVVTVIDDIMGGLIDVSSAGVTGVIWKLRA